MPVPKICQVIFSTNRLEYLIPTLRSQKQLNFEGCEVDKIFIDDYPRTRNDAMLSELVKSYGYDTIVFHKENMGLSVTWSELWNFIKHKNYDYVWHQEDDVEILEPIRILDLIELLNSSKDISQIQLARQKWYSNEDEPCKSDDDLTFKNFRYDVKRTIFTPMASLYSSEITKLNFEKYFNSNLNEGLIGTVLYEVYGKLSCNVRNQEGKNLIRHIGEYFTGMRVLPNEPGYEQFTKYDPNKKYDSRTGAEYK